MRVLLHPASHTASAVQFSKTQCLGVEFVLREWRMVGGMSVSVSVIVVVVMVMMMIIMVCARFFLHP